MTYWLIKNLSIYKTNYFLPLISKMYSSVIENSVYGLVSKIPEDLNETGQEYFASEIVLQEKNKYIWIEENLKTNEKYLIERSKLDLNQHRSSISLNLKKSKFLDEDLLENYKEISRRKLKIVLVEREKYFIEFSKNLEERNDFYLVKVYSLTETSVEGDKIINEAIEELKGLMLLKKPNLDIFQKIR